MQVKKILDQYDPSGRITLVTNLMQLLALGFFDKVRREIGSECLDAFTAEKNLDEVKATEIMREAAAVTRFVRRFEAAVSDLTQNKEIES